MLPQQPTGPKSGQPYGILRGCVSRVLELLAAQAPRSTMIRTIPYEEPPKMNEVWQIIREPLDPDGHNPRQQAVHAIEGFETHALALCTANEWIKQDTDRWGEEYTRTFLYTISILTRER